MISVKTDCGECSHSKVCQYKHNARLAMNKFKKEMFISGISNEACTWEDKMAQDHVNVEFSCPDYKQNLDTLVREYKRGI